MVASSWQETGLDHRLLRAVSKLGFTQPSSVQAAAVPAALAGRDVLARARTGSGKTLAYLLPALHRVITSQSPMSPWQVLVLVPTRELCDQVCSAHGPPGCHAARTSGQEGGMGTVNETCTQ
jgi:ATP-dependent RNA helicase DDX56/DBP9